jgi:hypothetical protein
MQADQFRHNVARMNRHAARAEARLQRRARLRRLCYRFWTPADREGDALDCLVSKAPKPKRRTGHLIPGMAGISLAFACFAVPASFYYNAGHIAPQEQIAAVEPDQPAPLAEIAAEAAAPQAAVEALAPQAPAQPQVSMAILEAAPAVEPEPIAIRGTLTTNVEPAASAQPALVPIRFEPVSARRVRQIGPYAVGSEHSNATSTLAYKLVHIADGRAMIEDEHGMTIVERGSKLPDNNKVEAIEQRDGRWVMVTSADEILTATE